MQELKPFIDAALSRLSKGAIKHWQKADEFHLSFEESEQIKDRAAKIELLRQDFYSEILSYVVDAVGAEISSPEKLAETTIEIIEQYLLHRGEEFAACVARDEEVPVDAYDLRSMILQKVSPEIEIKGRDTSSFIQSVIESVLDAPSETATEYINLLSDAYTLFAFLAEVPDVQSITKKMFGYGDVWLDTTVLLPIFGEQAFPQGMQFFTAMFLQAKKAGLKCYVTQGVLEEVERHFKRCQAFERSEAWQGRIPYVYSRYVLSGKPSGGFSNWLEQFCGSVNPERDIAEYLLQELGIELAVPTPEGKLILSDSLITAIKDYWQDVHRKRRPGPDVAMFVDRLAAHDSENHLHVLNARLIDKAPSNLGTKTWWLTLDSAARFLRNSIPSGLHDEIKRSPLMSVDFLLKYLAFGPNRDRLMAPIEIG